MKEMLYKFISEINPYEEFNDSTNLFETGILDSFGTMLLIEHIESAYGIRVDMENITLDDLSSISNIITYITSCGGR